MTFVRKLKNISMFNKGEELAHIIVEHFLYEKLYLEAKYKGKTFTIYIVISAVTDNSTPDSLLYFIQ